MSFCDKLIAHEIKLNCGAPITKGLEHEAVIINREDIDFASCSVVGNQVRTIALKSTLKGYKVTQYGQTPFAGSTTELNVGTNLSTWTRKIAIFVPTHGSKTSSSIIDPLSNGEFVVIVKNKTKGDYTNTTTETGDGYDNKYEVYGWYQGLKASAISQDPYSEDTQGGYSVELTEEGAPLSAMFLVNATSEAATDTAFNALT